MNMNTLLTSIRDAIAADSAIKTWTQSTYTKDHTVFVGVDTRNPPAEADCPCVVLSMTGKTGGYARDVISHSFIVSCEINKDSHTTTSNKIEYDGMQQLETFRQKVLTAIKALDLRVTEVDTTYETIMFYPAFLCDMVITIEEENEFGSDFIE